MGDTVGNDQHVTHAHWIITQTDRDSPIIHTVPDFIRRVVFC